MLSGVDKHGGWGYKSISQILHLTRLGKSGNIPVLFSCQFELFKLNHVFNYQCMRSSAVLFLETEIGKLNSQSDLAVNLVGFPRERTT